MIDIIIINNNCNIIYIIIYHPKYIINIYYYNCLTLFNCSIVLSRWTNPIVLTLSHTNSHRVIYNACIV